MIAVIFEVWPEAGRKQDYLDLAAELRPLLAQTYALSDIAQAQADFSAKQFLGKLALVPPQ